VIVILALFAAAVYYFLRSRGKTRVPGVKIPAVSHHQNLGYKPESKPISPVFKKSIPQPVQRPGVLPRPKPVSVVDGRADVTGSLHALVEKYSLDQFTIATSDGLVFASSGGESAQTDAARYGELFVNDPLAETPGVLLFGFTHKGSNLVGIIRTNLQIPEETSRMIEEDTKDILNSWI
jgi:hypothetical protein